MAQPNSLETSFSPHKSESATYAFRHQVKGIVETIATDDRWADQGLIFHTELIEMDDGIRYIVTTNEIEPESEREKDPANKQFPGSNILVLENTAWTTKNDTDKNGFYRQRHIANALEFHRPSMIVGVQQNLDRYVDFHRSTEDELAIYAFMAARFGYDPDYATAMGTSRGGMGALNKQKKAPKYGQKIIYADAMVPCVPFVTDTLKMISPCNMVQMAKNEVEAAKDLGLTPEELLGMRGTLDVLTLRGLVQQVKEGIALGTSNIGYAVRKSKTRDEVGHITVQKGDRMSFAHKWRVIFRDHPYMYVDVRDGGGHSSSVGREYRTDWHSRSEAVASVLHADANNRRLGSAAMRNLIDRYQARQNLTAK